MSKLRVFTAIVAVSLVMPLASAGQRGKPSKPPAPTPCTMSGEVQSEGTVGVSRDVGTYGPVNQALYIHERLLPPEGAADPSGGIALVKQAPYSEGFYGPYYGQIRVLDDRLDYFFDAVEGCVQDNAAPNLCPFRLTVADGTAIYEGKGKTRTLVRIAFDEGRYLLDYRPCNPALDPVNCYLKLLGCYDDRDCPSGEGYVYATFEARF